MAQGLYRTSIRGVAAGAGAGLLAGVQAGGRGGHGPIAEVVAQSLGLVTGVAVLAAGAGVGGVAAFGAGGLGDNCLVIVAQGRELSLVFHRSQQANGTGDAGRGAAGFDLHFSLGPDVLARGGGIAVDVIHNVGFLAQAQDFGRGFLRAAGEDHTAVLAPIQGNLIVVVAVLVYALGADGEPVVFGFALHCVDAGGGLIGQIHEVHVHRIRERADHSCVDCGGGLKLLIEADCGALLGCSVSVVAGVVDQIVIALAVHHVVQISIRGIKPGQRRIGGIQILRAIQAHVLAGGGVIEAEFVVRAAGSLPEHLGRIGNGAGVVAVDGNLHGVQKMLVGNNGIAHGATGAAANASLAHKDILAAVFNGNRALVDQYAAALAEIGEQSVQGDVPVRDVAAGQNGVGAGVNVVIDVLHPAQEGIALGSSQGGQGNADVGVGNHILRLLAPGRDGEPNRVVGARFKIGNIRGPTDGPRLSRLPEVDVVRIGTALIDAIHPEVWKIINTGRIVVIPAAAQVGKRLIQIGVHNIRDQHVIRVSGAAVLVHGKGPAAVGGIVFPIAPEPCGLLFGSHVAAHKVLAAQVLDGVALVPGLNVEQVVLPGI